MADEDIHCLEKEPAAVMHPIPVHAVRSPQAFHVSTAIASLVTGLLAAAGYLTAQAGIADFRMTLFSRQKASACLSARMFAGSQYGVFHLLSWCPAAMRWVHDNGTVSFGSSTQVVAMHGPNF